MIQVQVEVPSVLAAQLTARGQPIPHPVAGYALIDTGATTSAVDNTVIQQLGVQPVGSMPVAGVTGAATHLLYPCRFTFPGTAFQAIDFSALLAAPLTNVGPPGGVGPLLALIGRDLLQAFVLIYNGPGASFSLAV